MGLMKGLTEAWLQGTTFGFSDKVGLTGAGGLVHDSSDEVAHVDIDEDGIFFYEPTFFVKWGDVVCLKNLGNGWKSIVFRGGLEIFVSKIEVDWDVKFLARCDDGDDGRILLPCGDQLCMNASVTDVIENCDKFPIATSAEFKSTTVAFSDVFWAVDLADKIRDVDYYAVNEYSMLATLNCLYVGFQNVLAAITKYNPDVESATRYQARQELESFVNSNRDKLVDIVQDQLLRIDTQDIDHLKLASMSFAFVSADNADISKQQWLYDCKRNARALGYKFDENEDDF